MAILSSNMTVVKNFDVELPMDLQAVLGDSKSTSASEDDESVVASSRQVGTAAAAAPLSRISV